MTTATLSLGKVQKKIQSKIESVEMSAINWRTVCSIGAALCSVLLVFYVWQINSLTRGSFLIISYESQITKLTDENKNLQISFAENSFMDSALVKIQGLNFQKATSVKYINILDDSAKTTQANKNI